MFSPFISQKDKRKTDIADCAIEVPELRESGEANGAPIQRFEQIVSSDEMDGSPSNSDFEVS